MLPTFVAALAASAGAQEDPDEDQYLTWPDLMPSGSKFTLYGFLRADMQYNDSRMNDPQIPGYVRSEDSSPPAGVPDGVVADEDDDEFAMHARLTRLGMNVDGGAVDGLGDPALSGNIEIDFYNIGLSDSDSRSAIRMRRAYLKLGWEDWSLLAGQDWDLISPLYPAVNHDLVMWGAGNLGDRRPQLRAEHRNQVGEESELVTTFGIGLSGAVGGSAVTDFGGLRSGENSGEPMLAARVGYHGEMNGGPAQVGVWAHSSSQEYDATGSGEDEYDSSSVGIDFKAPIYGPWSVLGEYWMGENLPDVRGGIFQGVNPTTGDEIESEGGWLELAYQASEATTFHVGVSRDDPDDDDLDPFMRSKNSVGYVAARHRWGSLRAGVELLGWETDYVDLDSGDATRFVFWLAYYF